MIDRAKLNDVLRCYKRDFVSFMWNGKEYTWWKNEQYKWKAVKHFQEHWDVNAENFAEMLKAALSKTSNLLVSVNNFPRGMIEGFAKSSPEEVRSMFIDLYDEGKDVYERINAFKQQSAVMLKKYGGDAKQHYQYENAICTYLWLRYPDKYYIYRYSILQKVSEILASDYHFKQGAYADNIRNFLRMYDEISAALKEDTELVDLFKANLTDSCYPDPELKTLTVDFCFYIANFYEERSEPPVENEWFPDPSFYTPNISLEQWNALLCDPAVFDENSLKVIKAFYEVGGAATCSELAEKYGNNPMHYSGIVSKLANRVQKATNCPMIPEELSENAKWWTILFLGKRAEKERQGVYIWRLRDELKTAIKESLYNSEPAYSVYTKDNFLSEVYMTEERYNALTGVLQNKLNIILQGAPGVGKTFAARRLAWSMMGEKDDSRIEFVQFHQNYSYEDFMMGYKPSGEGFELKQGIFYRFCQKAATQPDKPFFFIIDEINRGNMSKIFGELLMLIEKDYRGKKITLAYNGLPFSVPENLYIIGMMNTADRSLAMIDYALRRRFSFFEMEPGFDSQGFIAYQNSLNNDTLNELISKVRDLNNEIALDKSLGKGFCIGHSYFCGRKDCTEEWLHAVVDYDILPMLREYWFDEPNKLQRWENILQGVFQS
ncbi:MAG TPA: restriction endonuclease [Ruminococcus sp.]|nr:restriction endonuclease [Ruminococcus sp.]